MRFISVFVAAGLFGSASPVLAQTSDFNLTYHVERNAAAELSIEDCGDAAVDAAGKAGLETSVQSFPDQLVTVTGGTQGSGAFVVQCIAVDDKTVSVVQGIDYRSSKGALGQFADQAFEAIKAAAE